MKLNQKTFFFFLFGISLMACHKEDPETTPYTNTEEVRDSILNSWDSLMVAMANEITLDLNGKWAIDSVEIAFQDSYENSQTGIQSDTTITDLGKINFGSWHLLSAGYADSTSYENGAELVFNNQIYPIKFNYLLHSPGESKVFSFLDRVLIPGNNNWDSPDGWFISNLGIFDNIEIVKLNPEEYYFIGLNRGIKKMKLRKIP